MILKPDYNVDSLFDIDFKKIKSLGINALLFDLDSTVMPSKSGEYPPKVYDLLQELKQNFVIAIISTFRILPSVAYDSISLQPTSFHWRNASRV